MINIPVIKQELFGTVGFADSIDPEYSIVNSENQKSSSGLTFQGGNNIVSIRNIKLTQEYPNISDEDFNAYLKELQEECVLDVVGKIIETRSRYLEGKVLFPYEQDFSKTETPDTGFLCVEIQPPINKTMLLHINSISLAIDGEVTINVYLKNSEIPENLFEKEITTKANQAVNVPVDFRLSLNGTVISDENTYRNLGGKYYLGYYVSDLNGLRPYKRDFELSVVPKYSDYMYFEFRNMQLDGDRINPRNPTSLTDPYGLNFDYSVYIDYTDILIKNKGLLARVIQQQMIEKVANLILTTTRSNPPEKMLNENIRNLAGFVLEGGENSSGIRPKIDREINNVKKMLFPRNRIRKATL